MRRSLPTLRELVVAPGAVAVAVVPVGGRRSRDALWDEMHGVRMREGIGC